LISFDGEMLLPNFFYFKQMGMRVIWVLFHKLFCSLHLT
jgi:hypothetical protein